MSKDIANAFPVTRTSRGLNFRFLLPSIVSRVQEHPVIHGTHNKRPPKAMYPIRNSTSIRPSQQSEYNTCEKAPSFHLCGMTELEFPHIFCDESQYPSRYSHRLDQSSLLTPETLAYVPTATSNLKTYLTSDEHFERFPFGLPSRRLGRPVLDPKVLQVLETL